VDRYKSLAVALESEVLSEMAGTFFGARKALEDLREDFMVRVEDLHALKAKVFARVFYLRSLLLGPQGQAEFFAALGLADPFPEAQTQSGSRMWRPAALPFALLPSTRFVKLLLLAYAELHRACGVYMHGEYEDDPDNKGRKRMSLHYKMVEDLGRKVNERVRKLNAEMPASSVLQYARSISTAEAPGQGAITNALGAESLDRGMDFQPLDLTALNVWRAPELPAPEACEEPLRAFAKAYYEAHADKIRRVLSEL